MRTMFRNKKGIFAIILCLILAFFAFVGCGDGNTPSDTGDPPEQPVVTHEYSAELGSELYLLSKGDEVDVVALSATLKCDGAKVDTATPVYSVADTKIATVSDGAITSVAVGETTVTATYSNEDGEVLATATAKVAVLANVESAKVNSFDESAVNLYGRTYISRERLVLENVCTGLETAFIGTELSIEANASDGKLRVYIDGDTVGKEFIIKKTKTTLKVCEKLTDGIHVVRILKASSPLYNSVSISGDSLVTDGKFLKPPAKPDLKIEVIGDSITAGCGSVGNDGSVKNSDPTKTYAFLAIQALDADFSVMALEGVCTKDGTTNAYGFYNKMSPNNSTRYDPALFDADIVIVGLGENDMWHATADQFDYTVEQFRQDYADFLRLIRASHPNAYIVCAYGMMPAASTLQAANTIKGAIADVGDDKISSVAMLSNEQGGNSHPCEDAHRTNSKTLVKHIAKLLEE